MEASPSHERTDMNNNPTPYPLAWPTGWPRTRASDRERSRFRNARAVDDQLSMSDATSRLIRECRLLGAANVIVSTNVAVRRDGLPYARQRTQRTWSAGSSGQHGTMLERLSRRGADSRGLGSKLAEVVGSGRNRAERSGFGRSIWPRHTNVGRGRPGSRRRARPTAGAIRGDRAAGEESWGASPTMWGIPWDTGLDSTARHCFSAGYPWDRADAAGARVCAVEDADSWSIGRAPSGGRNATLRSRSATTGGPAASAEDRSGYDWLMDLLVGIANLVVLLFIVEAWINGRIPGALARMTAASTLR